MVEHTQMTEITTPQARALRWLYNRSGSGVFEKNNQVVVAQGERSATERKTWNALRDAGLIEVANKRAKITETGEQYCRSHPGIKEAATVLEDDEW